MKPTVAYPDTSVLLAIAFQQPGWNQLARRLASFQSLVAGNLVAAEFLAALQRERVSGEPLILRRLAWILPDRSLEPEISRVLQTGLVRGADCWHLAVALSFAEDPRTLSFLTKDERQGEVARALGFPS